MTTKGWLVSGVAGIALLFGVGLLVVTWAERSAPFKARVPVPDAAAKAAAQPATLPPNPAPLPAMATPTALPPAAPVPAPPRPALPASMPERLRALEPLRQEVFAGLAELDGRIDACRLRGAVFVLTLETLDHGVRILEVQVAPAGADTAEATGAAPTPLDEGAVRCVRGALERTVFRAPSAVEGRRWQMSYTPGATP